MVYLKISCVVLLFGLMFYVGYQRKNFDKYFASQFTTSISATEKYPQTIGKISASLLTNYKWLSTTLYTIIYIVISLLILVTLFPSKKIIGSIVLVYVGLFLMSFLLILIGNAFSSYKFGYGMAQNLKKVVQTPIPTFFLILYYWKIRKRD